jgi:GNAT superfamily N-acetyltransferase
MRMTPTFRRLTRAELDTVLDWARIEGWNPGRHDAGAFWATDPEGFHGMEVDGRLIGSGSIVSYDGRLGFVGLFIVRPEFRGRGLGTQLWNHLIARLRERLEPGAPAGLDGVFAMQDYYARSGFAFTHRNLRMEGTGRNGARTDDLVRLDTLPFAQVAAFDQAHFGVPRPNFLRHWIRPPGGLALGRLRDGALSGIGVARPCMRGYKIGPLFAEDPETAGRLFAALSAFAAGHPIFLDIPEINTEAVALARRHGLKEGFGCARMVLGRPPEIPWRQIYGVTTFELG